MATPPASSHQQQITTSNNNNIYSQQQQANNLYDQHPQNYNSNPTTQQSLGLINYSRANPNISEQSPQGNSNEPNNSSYYSHFNTNTSNTLGSNSINTGLKACLKFEGNIDDMMINWSEDERTSRRRLVQFRPQYKGNTIHCHFNAVSQNDRSNNTTVLSCIYWDLKQDFYITSVDCIYLLEALLSVRFTVEEKNRIRRNLEGFRPNTVSKCKSETSEFFKLIMSFPNPKPRNIEKDVKVFPWKILPYALKKIIDKYTSNAGISKPPMVSTGLGMSVNSGGSSQALFQAPSLSQYTSYASTPYGYDGQISITPSHHGGPIRAFSGGSHPYQRRYSQPIQHGLGLGNNRIRPLNIAATNQFYSSIREEPSGLGSRQPGLDTLDSGTNVYANQNVAQDSGAHGLASNASEHLQQSLQSGRLLNNSSNLNTPYADNSIFKRDQVSPSDIRNTSYANQDIKNSKPSPSTMPSSNNLLVNDHHQRSMYGTDYMTAAGYNHNNASATGLYSRGYNNSSGIMGSVYENTNIDMMPPHPKFMESPSRRHLFINRRHSVADPYSIQKLQYELTAPMGNRAEYNQQPSNIMGAPGYNNENYMGTSVNKDENTSSHQARDSNNQIPHLSNEQPTLQRQPSSSYEQNENNNANY